MESSNEQVDDAVREFMSFPFDTDEALQVRLSGTLCDRVLILSFTKQGLAGVLGGNNFQEQDESNRQELLLQARIFYFNR